MTMRMMRSSPSFTAAANAALRARALRAQAPFTTTTVTALSSSDNSNNNRIHYPVVPKENHGPYQEFSVIHTDRSLNLMSLPFQTVMRDLSAVLLHTYNNNGAGGAVAIIPGYVCMFDVLLLSS